jgi:hypothetical protein
MLGKLFLIIVLIYLVWIVSDRDSRGALLQGDRNSLSKERFDLTGGIASGAVFKDLASYGGIDRYLYSM